MQRSGFSICWRPWRPEPQGVYSNACDFVSDQKCSKKGNSLVNFKVRSTLMSLCKVFWVTCERHMLLSQVTLVENTALVPVCNCLLHRLSNWCKGSGTKDSPL
jgi:hypothetical protein